MTQVRRDAHPRHPLPGSPEAIDLGCDCSFAENNRGIGLGDTSHYWIVVDRCPIHGRQRDHRADYTAMQDAVIQTTAERDRYFNMKRVNAGLYAFERAKVQKTRAVLGASSELYGNPVVGTALDILGELPPTDLHLHDLLDAYSKKLKEEHDKIDDVLDVDRAKFKHLQAMCSLTQDWFDRGESDKANRWLGFIQGAMWLMDVYTIDEMRAHIRGELPRP